MPGRQRQSLPRSRAIAPEPDPMGNSALDRLNEAGFDELRSMAMSVNQSRRLLAYREEHGGFQSLDELEGLAGFSRSSIKDLKDILVGTKSASANWVAPPPPSGARAARADVTRPPVARRRRRRRHGGVLLFFGFMAATALVLALAVTAILGPPAPSGACMVVLGIGIVATYREVAEVRGSLDLIRSRALHRMLAVAFGASLIVAGIARIAV